MHSPDLSRTNYTLESLFDQYMRLNSHFLSPHERRNRLSIYKNHFYSIRSVSIFDFDYSFCQSFINSLIEKGLRPKTVKNIKSFIQVIMNIAIFDGLIFNNPFQYVKLPSYSSKYKIPLNENEQKLLIRVILSYEEPIFKDIFLFLIHGRRLNEVLQIQWKDINLSSMEYIIPSSINKARQDMSYKMTSVLFNSIKSIYVRVLQNTGSVPEPSSYVFVNPSTKKPFSDLRKPWKRLLKSAHLPYTKLHSLRHIVGSYSINVLGIPIEKVSDTLGHTSIRTTEIYLNKRSKNSKEVISTLLNSINPATH